MPQSQSLATILNDSDPDHHGSLPIKIASNDSAISIFTNWDDWRLDAAAMWNRMKTVAGLLIWPRRVGRVWGRFQYDRWLSKRNGSGLKSTGLCSLLLVIERLRKTGGLKGLPDSV